MEIPPPKPSRKRSTPKEIMDSTKTEFDKINAKNATICWYDPTDGSEQVVKFADLPEEEQQSIRRGLEGFQQGHFLSLDDYERQVQSNS